MRILGAVNAGIAGLKASKTSYDSVTPDEVIAVLSSPYGAGSRFSIVGLAPSSLALTTDGKVLVGSAAQEKGRVSTLIVRVAKDNRAMEEPLQFTAMNTTPPPVTLFWARSVFWTDNFFGA